MPIQFLGSSPGAYPNFGATPWPYPNFGWDARDALGGPPRANFATATTLATATTTATTLLLLLLLPLLQLHRLVQATGGVAGRMRCLQAAGWRRKQLAGRLPDTLHESDRHLGR